MNTVKQLIQLAKDLVKAQKNSVAILALQRAYTLSQNPEELTQIAGVYFGTNQVREVMKCYQKALKIDPQFKQASIGLSVLYNDLGLYEKGKEVFDNLLEQQSQSSTHTEQNSNTIAHKILELAELYAKNGMLQFAVEEGFKALKLAPNEIKIVTQVSDWLNQNNEIDKSISLLEEARSKHPSNIEVRCRLAHMYYKKGVSYKGQLMWEEVLKLDPQNKEAKQALQGQSYIQETSLNYWET